MIRVLADGGGATYEPHPTTSTPPNNHRPPARAATPSAAQQATRAALRQYSAGNAVAKKNLETALWHEALSSASARRLLDDPATYQAERARLEQEYGKSLPKGMTSTALDSVWASTVANARATADQAPTTRALQQYGQAKLAKRTKGQPAPNSTVTKNAQRAVLAQVMDYYMAQHGQYFVPGSAGYSKEQATALADRKGLAAAEQTFEQAHVAALPKGVQRSDLSGLAQGGELDAARQLLPQQTSEAMTALQAAPDQRARASATSALETDGFNEEVMNYELTRHQGYAAPGSSQWNTDAQNLLNDPSALIAARDTVAVAHAPQLAAHGLNMRQFGADLWAGETVAQAELTQQHDENPPGVRTPHGPNRTLSAIDRRKQGEWDALTSLSQALNSLSSSGIDPALARQALMANGYVSALAGQISQTMQVVATSQGKTTADGIAFLDDTVKSSTIDPQLATLIVNKSAKTLQRYLGDQSGASNDQASQAFVSTAGIYFAMLTADKAGAAGAKTLAGSIALWSYRAANAMNSTITVSRFSSSPSPLDQMLQEVLSKAQQQKVAPNLLHAWVGLATSGKYQAVNNGLQQNDTAWSHFQQSLQANSQLANQPLPPNKTPLTTPSPAQSPDQVHASYDQILMALEQNGALPSNVDPTAAAAAQTMMSPGYVASDNVALARAMIAGKQQPLDAAWFAQHAGEGLTMPVDLFTEQAAEQVTQLNMVSARTVQKALRGMEAPLPTAPPESVIADTANAYQALELAKASGKQRAIATAQQAMNQAIAHELLSVYCGQFPDNALLTNDENSDWRILAEEQVARDHADDPQLASQLPALLEAGEITQASISPQNDQQTVAALDASLAPFQQAGADPGNAITQAVLNDARVRDLIDRQIMAATHGVKADEPDAGLAREAALIAPYERSDPNGPVAQQIVAGTVAAPVTQQILANARDAAARSHDPLGTAAPLMDAAQDSPTLALAVFNDFNLAGGSHQARGVLPPNQLVQAAGDLHNATDYRNAAIIYAALPDDPQVVGVTTQLGLAQSAKSAMLKAVGTQLRSPNDVASRNLKSWIRDSFVGVNSAPDWLAQDLAYGYRGSNVKPVGAVANRKLVSLIKAALYQSNGNNAAPSATPPSPDLVGQQNVDGLTLQQFDSKAALRSYVGVAYGLRPTSGSGANATYDLNAVVDHTAKGGAVTLNDVVQAIMNRAGVKTLSASTPIVLQATPVEINDRLMSAFRVQNRNGAQLWIGPDGTPTNGWAGQNALVTQDRSNTVMQVVGGVSEADAQGAANPLIKTDTPPPPPPPHHSIWLSIAEDAGAMVVGAVVTGLTGNPLLGAAAAFGLYQIVDTATQDGNQTLLDLGYHLVTGSASLNEAKQCAIDSGTEAIESLADGAGPWLGGEVGGGGVAGFISAKIIGEAATEGATAATQAGATAAASGLTRLTARVVGTAAGTTVNQAVQGSAQLATNAIDLATEGKLTRSAMEHAAIEQGVNLLPAAVTGGVSGLLPGPQTLEDALRGRSPVPTLIQTAVGYGSSLATTELDDRIFDHGQNITRDDFITAAIYTLPTTAVDLIMRESAARAATRAPRSAPAPRPTADPGNPGPAGTLAVEFGRKDRSGLETAVASGQFTPGQDRAYVRDAQSGRLIGYATLEQTPRGPQLIWRGDPRGASASEPFAPYLDRLGRGAVGIVMSNAAPDQVFAGGDLGALVPYSPAAMDYRGQQHSPNDPVAVAVDRGTNEVSPRDVAARHAEAVAAEGAPRVALEAAQQADRQGLPEQRAGRLVPDAVDRLRPTFERDADAEAGRIAAQQAQQAERDEQFKPVLAQADQAVADARGGLAALKGRMKGIKRTQGVDRYSYKVARANLRDALAELKPAEKQLKPTRQRIAADLRERLATAGRVALRPVAEDAARAELGEALQASIRESQAAAEARRAAAAARQDLRAPAVVAAERAVDGAQATLRDVAGQAALSALRTRPDDPAAVYQEMQTAVTSHATFLAADAARSAAETAAGAQTPAALLDAVVAAGETALDRQFDGGQLSPDRLAAATNKAREAATQAARQRLADRAGVDDSVNDLKGEVEGRAGDRSHISAKSKGAVDVAARATRMARAAAAAAQAASERADDVEAGRLVRVDYDLIVAKRTGTIDGGFYEEGQGHLRRFIFGGRKLLLKQPVDPQIGNGKVVAYAAAINNALLRLGLGADHVGDVRVTNMRLHLNDPETYGFASRLIRQLKYPEVRGSGVFDAKLQARLLDPQRAQKNGLFDYWALKLLTGAAGDDPLGRHSIGFTTGLTKAGDKVQIVDVEGALGAKRDGSYEALAQNRDDARVQINAMIDALDRSRNFDGMTALDRRTSVSNALHHLSEEAIRNALEPFRQHLSEARYNEILNGLLVRRGVLAEMFPEPDGFRPRKVADTASWHHWARRLHQVHLSPEHAPFWKFPRLAELPRVWRGASWDLVSYLARTDNPDADYYSRPVTLDPKDPAGVAVKPFHTSRFLRLWTTGAIFGLGGFGEIAFNYLPSALSEQFSIGRGFLNIFKLQSKTRKIALKRVRNQQEIPDIPRTMAHLQHYHVSLEHTLNTWMKPAYDKYITIASGTQEHLRRTTENALGRLANIDPQQPGAKEEVERLVDAYFKAHEKITNIDTADAQFFSQATNAGAFLQHGLVLGYIGSLLIDLHRIVTGRAPIGALGWFEAAPEYVNDVGKIGSLLNATSASWARWTTKFPFKPNEKSLITKIAKKAELPGNGLQGISSIVEALVSVFKANVRGRQGFGEADMEAVFQAAAGIGYSRRAIEAVRKGSAESEARSAAASALGGEGEGDTQESLEFFNEFLRFMSGG